MVAEICSSGPIGLIVAEICNSGTIGLVVVEIRNSGIIGLILAEVRNSSTIGLTVAKVSGALTNNKMALLDRVHDVGHLVTIMGNQASLLEVEIDKLKAKGDPKQLAIARQQVDELQVDNTKLKSELDELTRHLEQIDKELNELREGLAKSQR
ncbi:hypothetical protein BHE74_00008574 [Ensete ventricosum]|nr:hypothetical protein BHE74_00008574 [Ensete ventricosum]